MFWSQFILAKQGPLGTVWIAAHSVNASKLRKSQVSETDLAESCDTIIHQTFNHQKVPLALRLSGQLLLGVVRIYNRKLDFLHRDSAEALVKIRQAFHPGASVDLAPEALTAPLASITQPELDYESLDFYANPGSSYQLQLEPLASKEQIDLGDPFLGDLAAYAGEEEFEYGVLPEDEDALMETEEPELFRAASPGSARRHSSLAAVPEDRNAELPLGLDDEDHFVPMPEEFEDMPGGSLPVDAGARGGSLAGSLDLDAAMPTPGDSVGGTPGDHAGGLAPSPVRGAARERAAAPEAEKARKRKFKLDSYVVLSNAQIRAALSDVSDLLHRRTGLPHARGAAVPLSVDELLAKPAVISANACPSLRALFVRDLPAAAAAATRRKEAAPAGPSAAAEEEGDAANAGFAFDDDDGGDLGMGGAFEDDDGDAPPYGAFARSEGGGSFGGAAVPLGAALDAVEEEAPGEASGEAAEAGPPAWSKRTRYVLGFLQRSFAAAASAPDAHCSQGVPPAPLALEPLLAGESKGHAARLFFELLVLQTGGFLDLQQAQPYGDIAIAQTAKLAQAAA